MKYPNFINKNDWIGLVAPSMGSNKYPYRNKLNIGISFFENEGFKIYKGKYLYSNKDKIASTSAKKRALDFIRVYKKEDIDLVWSIAGGEIMFEILPYINFNNFKKYKAKYFVGFSDNTNLTYLLTINTDIATIYASHIGSYIDNNESEENQDLYLLLQGKKLTFNNYKYYTREHNDNPYKPVIYDTEVKYQLLNGKKCEFEGRIIGGCLDILTLIAGTKYDKTSKFLEKYKEDGFIFYLDSCDLNSLDYYRALLHLKYCDWFKYLKGFIIGRVNNTFEPLEFSFIEATLKALSEYNVPIIFDADIGHVRPSIPVINGSIAHVKYQDNSFEISYLLK